MQFHETDVNNSYNQRSVTISNDAIAFPQRATRSRIDWSIRAATVALRSTFLPAGFPHSVRAEYLTYQMWDSLQGVSSYLRSVITTRSVLTGAGVGSATASAINTALVWVSKDGIGMIGSLSFAYAFADLFEVNVKEWRLLADVLNNVGQTIDLMISMVPGKYFFLFISLSTLSKSLCGLIAGATKARISQHFAKKGHLADVTAKESTQETAVALVGLLLGMVLTKVLADDVATTAVFFSLLLVLHQWANYNLVKVLILDTINPQRAYLLTRDLMMRRPGKENGNKHAKIPSPEDIRSQEFLHLPIWLSVCGPQLGVSISSIVGAVNETVLSNSSISNTTLITQIVDLWKRERFILAFDRFGRVVVALSESANEHDITKAYFIACYVHHFLRKDEQKNTTETLIDFMFVVSLSIWSFIIRSVHAFGSLILFGKSVDNKWLKTQGLGTSRLSEKFQKLLNGLGLEACDWYRTAFSAVVAKRNEEQDNSNNNSNNNSNIKEEDRNGWDFSDGTARLGPGRWRYRRARDGYDSSSKDKNPDCFKNE